jgi:predicted DNA-binding transcriptional regulator AlpA
MNGNCYSFEEDINKSKPIFDNLPELIKPKQLAELLSISVATVYDWKYKEKTRKIPKDLFLKMNRSLYINTEVLRSWITSLN